MLEEDIENYMWAAENVAFPVQWRVLAGMRGGLHEGNAREKDKIGWKRRQIFFQLLTTLQMRDAWPLSWWAMIQTVANFGWGVGATAGDIHAYWGMTVSLTARKHRITQLTSHLLFHYHP